MPSDDANFSTPLGGWKVSALHSTFLRGKCERFWTLPSGDGSWKTGVSPKAPIKTGGNQRMKESYYEGIASHIGPESCLDDPQGRGEALTGESTGVVLNSENTLSRRPSQWAGAKATRMRTLCKCGSAPAESETNACVDGLHTGIGRPRKGVRA